MTEDSAPPILRHALDQPSAFTPKNLIDDVRRSRQIPVGFVPPLCVLEFDGDITDWLVRDGLAKPFEPWACFHTSMFTMDLEGVTCGIIARTIGGPYAVLIAEQLQAAGAKLIIGLTSAGRVAPDLPLPCLVVATSAIRDEGTSYHYLPPDSEVACKSPVVSLLERELIATGWAVRSGKVWTTDAPYRETKVQLNKWAREGALAVEMQAASLFAFGIARQAPVASVAMVSNAVDHTGAQFDTGSQDDGLRVLKGIARAARSLFVTSVGIVSSHMDEKSTIR
jgi:uridine phosphorylase